MSWVKAAGIVLAMAVFGAVISGDPTSGPYAALTKPDFSPPLWGWVAVAAAYYTGMIAVLGMLLRSGNSKRGPAIAAVLGVLALNKVWNVFLFRLGRADLAFYALIPFVLLVLATGILAARVSRTAAGILFAYLLWLGFDLVWAWRLMALN